MNDSRLSKLKLFLHIYGWLSLVLFGVLMIGFIVEIYQGVFLQKFFLLIKIGVMKTE